MSLRRTLQRTNQTVTELQEQLRQHEDLSSNLQTQNDNNERLLRLYKEAKDHASDLSLKVQDLEKSLMEANSGNQALGIEVVALRETASKRQSQVIVAHQQLQEGQNFLLTREQRCASLETLLEKRNEALKKLQATVQDVEERLQMSENVCHRAVLDRDNLHDDLVRVRRDQSRTEEKLRKAELALVASEEVKRGLLMDLKALQSKTRVSQLYSVFFAPWLTRYL